MLRPVGDLDTATLTLGDIQVTAMVDVLTSLESAEIFATAPLPWPVAELDDRFPGDFADGRWRFIMRSFLISTPRARILVDAGAGPATSGMCRAMGIEGHLLDRLAELDTGPEQIDHVVISHLHDDHVGWLVVPGPTGPRPVFPAARYHLHPADLALAEQQRDTNPGRYWDTVFGPLSVSGRLELDPADRDLAPGVRLLNAPGHTPGHRVVEVSGGGRRLLIVGDLVHFSFQLADPSIVSPFDGDKVAAAAARRAVLGSAPDAVIGSPHLPDAFTTRET